MDAVPHSSKQGGFLREWLAALGGMNENPVAGWLLTAQERRVQKFPLLRKLALPLIIGVICGASFIYAQRSNTMLVDAQVIELVMVLLTVSVIPAVLVWCITGIFQAVLESLSLLADESHGNTSLTMDDMVSVSQMSSADIAIGALQVILPQLFWKSLAISLSFWWIMLMLTSMFGTDLRSESFASAWTWGIVTVPLMLLSSLLACIALVLACMAAGMRARGTLLPLASATLVMLGSLAWFIIGGAYVVKDEYVVHLTRADSIYGSLVFLGLAFVIALIMNASSGPRLAWAVLIPMFAGISVFVYLKFLLPNQHTLPESMTGMAAGFIRSWGSYSIINPLFVPTPASWGDVFMRNPVTGENAFKASLEMRWMVGFLLQLGLVWINAWLAWNSIMRKRSS